VSLRTRGLGLSAMPARRFVTDSKGRPGASFRGFTCRRRVVEADELPHPNWRCVGGDRVVRWQRY
jgi:hypothetical protein